MIQVSEYWKRMYPGACLGTMVVSNVKNKVQCAALEEEKRKLESQLRSLFVKQEELAGYGAFPIYSSYYKRYKKTYHVLKQLESIVFRDRKIPQVATAVEAMFMAELKNGLLTAGHDCQVLQWPVTLTAAAGEECYTMLSGPMQQAKAQDMVLADSAGIISSIIHGPDFRTRITAETEKILFTVYAPAGIELADVTAHLQDIYRYLLVASPETRQESLQVYPQNTLE